MILNTFMSVMFISHQHTSKFQHKKVMAYSNINTKICVMYVYVCVSYKYINNVVEVSVVTL